MKELALLRVIGAIDDDLVAAASLPPHRSESRAWMHLLTAAACFVLICTLLLPRFSFAGGGAADEGAAEGEGAADGSTAGDAGDPGSDKGDSSTGDGGCFFSFTPTLWYGGRGYQWHDVVHTPAEEDGWVAVGELAGTVAEEGAVLDDFWLSADFEAAGTVYVSEQYPDMLYVRITTPWLEDTYVAFMIPPLSYQPMICFDGRIYCPAAHSNPDIKAGTALPQGFVNAGTVTKATFGKVPDENGETTGWYNGCTIFAHPDIENTIYLGAYRSDSSGTQYIYAPAPLLTRELAGELTVPQELLNEN